MTTSETIPFVQPANEVSGPPQGCWNYETYAAIPDDGHRYEVIGGVLYVSAAPSIAHQRAIVRLGSYLFAFVEAGGLGIVLAAPVDVELTPGGDVVQPDVVVVLSAHKEIITSSRIIGAPDLVIEVTSPSTATYDRRGKMDAYARAGVPEYWIANPIGEFVELFLLEPAQRTYTLAGVFEGTALLPSRVLPGFPARVEQFFA